MSFLYRHLVIPDLAPPTCESNKFLFYGGTVTSSCDSNFHSAEARSRSNFASSSILARSARNCRLPQANSRSLFGHAASSFRGDLAGARKGKVNRKILQIIEGK